MTVPFRGSSSDLTKGELRSKRHLRLLHDVYVQAGSESNLGQRVDAGLAAFPDAIPCLFTAGLLQKLPLDDDGLVHLDRGKGSSVSERRGLKVHRYGIAPERTMVVKGRRIADGPQTLAHLSEHLSFEDLVAVGDVVAKRWSPAEIQAALEMHAGHRGAVLLKRAVPLLDKGSDSPPETRARLRLHAAGFVGLQTQVQICDARGGCIATTDLGDPEAKVGVQYQGIVHFEQVPKRMRRDAARDEHSRGAGWSMHQAFAEDDARPELLIAKVTAGYLAQARILGPHILPDFLQASCRS